MEYTLAAIMSKDRNKKNFEIHFTNGSDDKNVKVKFTDKKWSLDSPTESLFKSYSKVTDLIDDYKKDLNE